MADMLESFKNDEPVEHEAKVRLPRDGDIDKVALYEARQQHNREITGLLPVEERLELERSAIEHFEALGEEMNSSRHASPATAPPTPTLQSPMEFATSSGDNFQSSSE